jgi:hypothetical protein
MIDFEDISLAAAKYAQNEPKCPFYDESDIYEKVYMAFKAGANYVLSNQSTATMSEWTSEGMASMDRGWSSGSGRYTGED